MFPVYQEQKRRAQAQERSTIELGYLLGSKINLYNDCFKLSHFAD